VQPFSASHGRARARQRAALAAIPGPQAHVDRMRRAYEERRDLLLAGLKGCPAVTVPAPRGAFYAFADVSAARQERDIWTLVDEWLGFGVAVLPGSAFGPEFGDRVRLSLATRREDVVDAANLIRHRTTAAVVR